MLFMHGLPSFGVNVMLFLDVESSNDSYIREGVFYGQCSELCGVNHGLCPLLLKQ